MSQKTPTTIGERDFQRLSLGAYLVEGRQKLKDFLIAGIHEGAVTSLLSSKPSADVLFATPKILSFRGFEEGYGRHKAPSSSSLDRSLFYLVPRCQSS